MIKNNLQHILIDKGTNMKRLSEELDIVYPTIWRFGKMEAGSVNFDVLNAICAHLGVQPGDILEFIPDEEADS